MENNQSSTIIGLDVGGRRIGVAVASLSARLAGPLMTLENKEDIYEQIAILVEQVIATRIIVGLPRGLDGQETAQTLQVREFVDKLKWRVSIPIELQDEALTSRQAEEEFRQRGIDYSKADVDSLAATYILDDYLFGHPEV